MLVKALPFLTVLAVLISIHRYQTMMKVVPINPESWFPVPGLMG